MLDTAPCADISGELGSGGEFLAFKPRERVAAALPNVYLPETHFGVALGEARTLRTGTNEHTEHSPKRQNLATLGQFASRARSGRVRGLFFWARYTPGNRGNIGIALPPASVSPN